MAGAVSAREFAHRITRRDGATVTAGLPDPKAIWNLQAVSMIAEEHTLKGSYVGSCVASRDVPRFVAMYRAGRLPVDRMMSEHLPLDQINEGFDRLARGESIRQIVLT